MHCTQVPEEQIFPDPAQVLSVVPSPFVVPPPQVPPEHVLPVQQGLLQSFAAPAVHVPAWQVLGKQASVEQSVLLAFAGLEQTPAVHVPAVWHTSEAEQVTAVPGVHVPAWQVLGKQASVEQFVLLAFAGLEQFPVPGSHVPAVWHTSEAEQVTAVPGVQTPAWQVSPVVQEFPSLHVVLFATATQVPVADAHV